MADRFDKFSERARLALMLAQEEAQRFGHTFIGAEHILLGIVRQPDSTATKVLDALNTQPVAVRAAIEAAITRAGPVVLGEIGLTPRAKKAIEYAVDEARRLESHVIGTEHLLLGILGLDGDLAAGVLSVLGVTLETARAEVRRRLARVAPRPTFASQRSSISFRSAGASGPRDALEATTRALRILHDTAGWLERDGLDEAATALRDIQQQLARFVARDTRLLLAAQGEPAGPDAAGRLVLFGGPAGAGKSTLAAAWCATRPRAVHIELDAVRELIVAGRADPQGGGVIQAAQYALSVAASLHLGCVFLDAGYDVAIDDVIEPEPFAVFWRPALAGRAYQLVVVTPSLDATLARAAARAKQVRPDIIRGQHDASLGWPVEQRIDTTTLSPEQSLEAVLHVLAPGPTAG